MIPIYIHSPALSKFGKQEKSVLQLSKETASSSISTFEKERIDLLVFTSFTPERYTNEFHLAAKLADALNLNSVFAVRTETASSSGASALHVAYSMLSSGLYKNALIVGTEIMSKLEREESNLVLGSVLSDRMRNFSMSMAQGAAMITNRYLNDYGYKRDDLFFIAKKLHDNGFQNPNAHIKKQITESDYFKAPIFSDPLGLYDISPLSDGSSSLILSSEIKSNILIRGIGHGLGDFKTVNLGTSFTASKIAFKRAYDMAKINPKDIQIAELHDAFTTFELIGAEDAGLFPKGHALNAVKDGVSAITGDLPINASGGLKSRGHPIGASGLAQIAEIIRFMSDGKKNIGLIHSIGGLATNNFATILEQI
ncbi:MAG: thiolase family protein [Leptospiraceae bacterium]|nr:thiolase family protein [Leptospiraceae bacterium]